MELIHAFADWITGIVHHMDLMEHIHAFATWIVDFVHRMGLLGIFVAAFLESTFVPIPGEVTMIPAGYLVYQGKMNFWAVLGLSVAGTIVGSLVNYYIARLLGRPIIVRFQKYLFLNDTKIYKIEAFFAHHGEISTLIGRLVPAMRHLIAFPAGLARMDVRAFTFYTFLGGTIWMSFLIWVGYFLGGRDWRKYVTEIIGGGVLLAVFFLGAYILYVRRTAKKDDVNNALKETLKELEPHHKLQADPDAKAKILFLVIGGILFGAVNYFFSNNGKAWAISTVIFILALRWFFGRTRKNNGAIATNDIQTTGKVNKD